MSHLCGIIFSYQLQTIPTSKKNRSSEHLFHLDVLIHCSETSAIYHQDRQRRSLGLCVKYANSLFLKCVIILAFEPHLTAGTL